MRRQPRERNARSPSPPLVIVIVVTRRVTIFVSLWLYFRLLHLSLSIGDDVRSTSSSASPDPFVDEHRRIAWIRESCEISKDLAAPLDDPLDFISHSNSLREISFSDTYGGNRARYTYILRVLGEHDGFVGVV